jgi:hypothetical protein
MKLCGCVVIYSKHCKKLKLGMISPLQKEFFFLLIKITRIAIIKMIEARQLDMHRI